MKAIDDFRIDVAHPNTAYAGSAILDPASSMVQIALNDADTSGKDGANRYVWCRMINLFHRFGIPDGTGAAASHEKVETRRERAQGRIECDRVLRTHH